MDKYYWLSSYYWLSDFERLFNLNLNYRKGVTSILITSLNNFGRKRSGKTCRLRRGGKSAHQVLSREISSSFSRDPWFQVSCLLLYYFINSLQMNLGMH